MISSMFNSYEEPFYHSAESVELHTISEPKYEEFCLKNFEDYGKAIETRAVEFAYDLAAGNTYEIQRIMRTVFAATEKGRTATPDDIKDAVNRILDRQDQIYRERMTSLNNTTARRVLIAIALEGVATGLLSKDMADKYDLGPASSVAKAAGNLCAEDKLNLVLKTGGSYKLQDKMFELWIARQYDRLEFKFANAALQFGKETEMAGKVDLPKLPAASTGIKELPDQARNFSPVTRPLDGLMNYVDENYNILLNNWVEKAEPFRDGKANIVFGGIPMVVNTKGEVVSKEESPRPGQSKSARKKSKH